MNTRQKNIMLKFITVRALQHVDSESVIEIGKHLLTLEADDLATCGFWILDLHTYEEFYSPKFRYALGFENEEDFPNHADSWQKQIEEKDKETALFLLEESMRTGVDMYDQVVVYNKKHGGKITVRCSGNLIKVNNVYRFLIGSHECV